MKGHIRSTSRPSSITTAPALGRFLQTDPIGYGDNMNMYAYAGNDPVNYVDPWGLAGVSYILCPLPYVSNATGGMNGSVTFTTHACRWVEFEFSLPTFDLPTVGGNYGIPNLDLEDPFETPCTGTIGDTFGSRDEAILAAARLVRANAERTREELGNNYPQNECSAATYPSGDGFKWGYIKIGEEATVPLTILTVRGNASQTGNFHSHPATGNQSVDLANMHLSFNQPAFAPMESTDVDEILRALSGIAGADKHKTYLMQPNGDIASWTGIDSLMEDGTVIGSSECPN